MNTGDGVRRASNIKPIQGSPADLSRYAIAVSEDVAKDKGLSIGDVVPVAFKDTGAQQLRVAMIYARGPASLGSYLLGMPAYDANFPTHFDKQVIVKQSTGRVQGQRAGRGGARRQALRRGRRAGPGRLQGRADGSR